MRKYVVRVVDDEDNEDYVEKKANEIKLACEKYIEEPSKNDVDLGELLDTIRDCYNDLLSMYYSGTKK